MPPSIRRPVSALVAALVTGLWVAHPTPSAARSEHARQPPRATPVERALTGGIVVLRAPASGMIRVPESRFVLGSSPGEVLEATASCAGEPLGHYCTERTFSNELPQTLTRVASFWLDRTEVTVEAFERCVALGACPPRPIPRGGERLNGAKLPATLVSASEAESYCRFRRARLPTEAEFERAARGNQGRRYPWGQLYHSRLANHGRLGLDRTDARDGFEELAPVGSFAAGRTPDGFLDLAGNASEWTGDAYAERHGLSPEPGARGARVVKGGGYDSAAAWLRGAARKAVESAERAPFLGFRCARATSDATRERP